MRVSIAHWAVITATVLLLSACSNAPICDEPEFYEAAQLGKRIEAPEDLDPLEPSREMVIPEPSPRAPRPPGSGCIDMPPTLRTES